jgi:hypothetical protein
MEDRRYLLFRRRKMKSDAKAANASREPTDRVVWGAAGIAQVIGRSTDQTNTLLQKGLLDADKKGRLWVSTERRLLRDFGS